MDCRHKFFILIGIIAALLLITRQLNFLKWLLYILFYPVILIFWRLPQLAYKLRSWIFAVAIVNAALSLFRSLKLKFVTAAVFLISMLFALTFSNHILLIIAIVGLFSVLVVSYARMSIFVFQPSSIFQLYTKVLKKSPTFVTAHFIDAAEIRNLPMERLNDAQILARRTNIQSLVLFNRALLFLSHRLREYQQSKLNALSYAFNLLLLLGFTIIAYAATNYALFKLDPTQFTVVATEPGFFLFLYYSFHTFIFGSIGEITPVHFYSQAVSMSEQVLAILLLFILVGLFISVQSERYKEELDRTIAETEETGRTLEELIQSTYNLTFEQALEEIRKMQANLINIILWLSKSLSGNIRRDYKVFGA